MKIKTSFISSSFENDSYPKGIACVQCTIQNQNYEISFFFVRKADEFTIEGFVQNDNLCQKLAIEKTLKMLHYIENISFQSNNEENVLTYQDVTYQDSQTKKVPKDSYKQKVIEIINLLNWNVSKLSKFVQKFKKKKINELSSKEWEEIYTYLSKKLTPTMENESISNSIMNEQMFFNQNENLRKEESDIEIIKPEEWEEII